MTGPGPTLTALVTGLRNCFTWSWWSGCVSYHLMLVSSNASLITDPIYSEILLTTLTSTDQIITAHSEQQETKDSGNAWCELLAWSSLNIFFNIDCVVWQILICLKSKHLKIFSHNNLSLPGLGLCFQSTFSIKLTLHRNLKVERCNWLNLEIWRCFTLLSCLLLIGWYWPTLLNSELWLVGGLKLNKSWC